MASLPKIKDLSALFGGLGISDTDVDSLSESMEKVSLCAIDPMKNVYALNDKLIVWNPRFDPYTIFCYHTGNVLYRF